MNLYYLTVGQAVDILSTMPCWIDCNAPDRVNQFLMYCNHALYWHDKQSGKCEGERFDVNRFVGTTFKFRVYSTNVGEVVG